MDIVLAVSNYLGKMVSADGAAGSSGKMKILLLDSETVSFAWELPRGAHHHLTI